jgi:SnoaL-like domain
MVGGSSYLAAAFREEQMTLDTADRLEIFELYARAAVSFDTGDAEGFARCFTAEGVFESRTPIAGHEELVAYVTRRFAEAPGMAHHVSNIYIDETDEGARGTAYGVILATAPDGRLQLRTAGTYKDELVSEHGRWRIRHRRFHPRVPAGQIGADLTVPTGS